MLYRSKNRSHDETIESITTNQSGGVRAKNPPPPPISSSTETSDLSSSSSSTETSDSSSSSSSSTEASTEAQGEETISKKGNLKELIGTRITLTSWKQHMEKAVKTGNLEDLEFLIELTTESLKVDIHKEGEDEAVEHKKFVTIIRTKTKTTTKQLLNIPFMSNNRETCLLAAARLGDWDMVDILLKHGGIDRPTRIEQKDRQNPIHQNKTIKNNFLPIMDHLIRKQYGIKDNENIRIDTISFVSRSCLHYAFLYLDEEMIIKIVNLLFSTYQNDLDKFFKYIDASLIVVAKCNELSIIYKVQANVISWLSFIIDYYDKSYEIMDNPETRTQILDDKKVLIAIQKKFDTLPFGALLRLEGNFTSVEIESDAKDNNKRIEWIKTLKGNPARLKMLESIRRNKEYFVGEKDNLRQESGFRSRRGHKARQILRLIEEVERMPAVDGRGSRSKSKQKGVRTERGRGRGQDGQGRRGQGRDQDGQGRRGQDE